MALTRHDVITGALDLADADGLDALTLRSLATRLGVQAPTLYWHVRNKAELLDALGDAIMDDVFDGLPASDDTVDAPRWMLGAAVRLRGALVVRPYSRWASFVRRRCLVSQTGSRCGC